jgi:hypothetical protein
MNQAEKILGEMEGLLDSLIESARTLLNHSTQVIDENELVRLQEEQEILLTKLIDKDTEFHQLPNHSNQSLMSIRLKIDEKIDLFQKLNAEFVENINAANGLIQFKEERDSLEG